MTAKIIPERFEQITSYAIGSHSPGSTEMCFVEGEAWIAGEPWSDHPDCVCPVLAAFGRSWNDGLSGPDRDRLLLPFKGRLVGTRSTVEVEEVRGWLATDWLVRSFTPVWLRAAGLVGEAERLEGLDPIVSVGTCRATASHLVAARDAAWDAAGAAAWDAAGAAAWVAAGDAAGDAAGAGARAGARVAAGDAAGIAAGDAAWAAAWVAARVAARVAAGDAAGAAARDALRPHVVLLQTSAADLFDRMIQTGTQEKFIS